MLTGGAPLTAASKQRFVDLLPNLLIVDVAGASETGGQLRHVSSAAGGVSTGTFQPLLGTCVVSEDRTRALEPGHAEIGWLARSGRIPLGYLGDKAKTNATFPDIDGTRYVVPGDRARHLADGSIELLGRDSVTINTGGEKVFAEEVEQVLSTHPAVYDVVVVGRPSERWGQEVVAVVQLRPGHETDDDDLRSVCDGQLARFKRPKDFVRVDEVRRSPAGKADYAWAREQAELTVVKP
jgi:fatty-acyl-CoA synthase